MSRPRKVLYLQHATALGGSVISLLYTMQGLDPTRYTPVVALAKPAKVVSDVYEKAGIETLTWGGIETFEHTTAAWTSVTRPGSWRHLATTMRGFSRTVERTRALVEHVKPDLVHLNSAVLGPSAWALRHRSFPLVWHVRETPVPGHTGARKTLLGEALRTLPDQAIFLSEAERRAWVGEGHGAVVSNFVNVDRFTPVADPRPARRSLDIPEDAKVVLYLGGASMIKGALPFVEAMALVRERVPNVVALLPNSIHGSPSGLPARLARKLLPLVGTGTTYQRFEQRIDALKLTDACRRFGFRPDVDHMLEASDLLVFPAIREHFARPVVEANAMAKPVVVSRLPVLDEMVEEGVNGLLAEPNNPVSLADAICRVLEDPAGAARMGEAGRKLALERYDQRRGVARIMELYDRAFARRA